MSSPGSNSIAYQNRRKEGRGKKGGTSRMAYQMEVNLPPNPTWVWCLGPIPWKERTSFHKLTWCAPSTWTNKYNKIVNKTNQTKSNSEAPLGDFPFIDKKTRQKNGYSGIEDGKPVKRAFCLGKCLGCHCQYPHLAAYNCSGGISHLWPLRAQTHKHMHTHNLKQ